MVEKRHDFGKKHSMSKFRRHGMQKIGKQEESKGSRIAYSVFIGIAISMVCINLYFSLCS